ncbi:TetR/AcrR family transcriptional regulator [Rhizobium sullae]|uniref:TetR family transcriptional regulator n=1 Tax=Rhizobium sullae TaxID=50338 RepID=A0A4R3PYR1_RHISU|nr:TetR/AcrR family transcriptional regulator [Rhizobium sullae]TCU13429.1 TetR family transcriptional regulator [Rhizobium sullae]
MSERGRPRSFDRQKALSSAMRVFWEKGFEETSMTDLTQAMGIASPSLYAAFGCKEALFREALDLYQRTVNCEIWDALNADLTIEAAIEAFFVNTARAYSQPDVPAGCLIVLGARPAPAFEATDPVHDDLKSRRADNIGHLRDRLQRAIAEGQLSGTFNCDSAATFLATLQNGMSLLARDGADAQTLMSVAHNGSLAFQAMVQSHAA